MIVGINMIALPAEKGSGAFRYFQMLLNMLGEYDLVNVHFIIAEFNLQMQLNSG